MSLPIRTAFVAALFILASAPASFAMPSSLNFTVLRNGDPVGTDTYTFSQTGGETKVSVDTHVVVKIVFVPVYHFETHAQEIWRDNRLAALTSKSDDDGKKHVLTVAADAKGLAVDGDNKPSRAPLTAVPASLWDPATVKQTALLNTLDGHMMTVHVADKGMDTVKVHGKPVQAHHYVLTGDLSRQLWYDQHGTLVQVRFKAKDDSDIRYVLN